MLRNNPALGDIERFSNNFESQATERSQIAQTRKLDQVRSPLNELLSRAAVVISHSRTFLSWLDAFDQPALRLDRGIWQSDTFAMPPKPLKVVIRSCAFRENMHDEVPIVE